MISERWKQIETLFHSALDRAPNERAAFLAGADAELRVEVLKLLRSFDEAGEFIERPLLEDSLGPRPEVHAELLIGQKIGSYEILSLLGAGGMGEVYLARDARLDRQIALKLLPTHFTSDAEQVRRFEREARAVSALNHPNILTIHEIGQDGDTHFIATEFVAGQTLRDRINASRLAVREAASIAAQIANALEAAHSANIIHRDIKPENVMVRPDGLVKLLDFGLAKPSGLRTADFGLRIERSSANPQLLTDPNTLMGTLAYLSPEQVRLESVDHRTDLFSLGVVLYEMLAGTRPFKGANALSTSEAILNQTPESLEPVAGTALNRIVMRALMKAPGQRYQSAETLRADLLKAEQRLQAAPASRRRVRYAVAAAVILAAAFGFWRWLSSTQPPVFNSAAAQKLTNLPGQELFPSLSPDGKTVIFASPQTGSLDIYRQVVGQRVAVNLTAGSTESEFQPAFSPDGARIAFRSSRDGAGIFVMNSDGGNITKISGIGFNPTWSPDGTEIAVAEDIVWNYEGRNTYPSASKLWAINVVTRERRVITEHDAVQPNWSPNGHRLAFWGEQKGGHRDIWTVAASGGEATPVTPVTDDEDIDWNPVWSPDGNYLYFLSNRGGEMNLWRVAIDERTGQLRGSPEPATLQSNDCQHVSFARNGNGLVYGQTTQSENLWQLGFDPASGQVIGTATPLTQGLKRYALFSLAPDEQSFAYLARGEPQQDLFIANSTGAPLQRLTDDAAQDIIPRWSPDGKWIAFISDRSGKYEIWKVRPDGTELQAMTHEPGKEVIAPVWSPDSSKLLYQIRNANSFIVDATRPGSEQQSQGLPGQPPEGFLPWEWSPDGTMLAGWQPPMPQQERRGIVVYSFAQQRYDSLPGNGMYPAWLNDNRRILYRDNNALFLLDRMTGQSQKIYAVTSPNQIGHHLLSRDNRRLYFTSVSVDADIWILPRQ
ncbi:MAG: protein kinase domain-containing protein [Blastocatellia bacterium]